MIIKKNKAICIIFKIIYFIFFRQKLCQGVFYFVLLLNEYFLILKGK